MIKVAFIGVVSKEWMGGLNYFKNLLYALSTLEEKELEIFVFVGKKTDEDIKAMFRKYATVIENSMFDRKSIKWFLAKVEKKLFKTDFLILQLLQKHGIQILSHSSMTKLKNIKTINWIPDFQHIHLPNMFSEKEIINLDNSFNNLIQNSSKIVVSSQDALNDLKTFTPKYKEKAAVLEFVSQPYLKYFDLAKNNEKSLRMKYNLIGDFFYLPNQFWKHKNHMMVFEAVNNLLKEGNKICMVCTGHLEDYRNKEYINKIKLFIKNNNLYNNIRLLGLIDYEEVFCLIKFSKAVINPSLFEGWSSTVEECKSVGKNMILSDLNVHIEQYPTATFFERNNLESLKSTLLNYDNSNLSNDIKSIEKRTELFGNKYLDIIKEVLNEK